ncbi:hypothetical protein [Thiofilum flexile]|uniref:hypothetical protein n=1 Tax=Thiofilum flexile TaxID=125627 RepID=UPI001FDF330B|nr:hypothetical protein [Thiofilum flexile]
MQSQLLLPNLDYRYQVLDMYTVDCSLLLAQDTPEALVLAILCDFKQRPVQEVVNYIVVRLRELTGDDEKAFRNYYEMLETLADNRNLQANLDEAKHMLTQVDITRFSTYRWGFEKGIEQAREELQPLLDAEKQRLLQGVKQLISMNTMSHQAIADLFQLSLAEVEQIAGSTAPTQH